MRETRLAAHRAHKQDWIKLSAVGIGLPVVASLVGDFSYSVLGIGWICFIIGGCAGTEHEKSEQALRDAYRDE